MPDGDTGTNMALTLESVVGELDGAAEAAPMAEVCEAIAHGSLMGARGNSGVILSQILRGLADTFSPLDDDRPATDVAAGLRRAADAAYQAVLRPVEGTILTVVRSAAEAVERAVTERRDHPRRRARAGRRRGPRGGRRARPTCCRCCARPASSTPAGAGFALLLDAFLHVVDRPPAARAAEVVHAAVAVEAAHRRRRTTAVTSATSATR